MKVYYTTDDWDSETEVTGIDSYPEIIYKNDSHSVCSFSLVDFEGSLFATWNGLDEIKMRIEDNSSNVIFRGYLVNKRFSAKKMILELAGFGIALQWQPFGSTENVSYILEEGKVAVCNASSTIDLFDDLDEDGHYDGAGEDFSWTADQWHDNDKDLGLMIIDNTQEYTEKSWTASALASTGETSESGVVADTQTFDDGDYYWLQDTTASPDAYVSFTMDNGDQIPDTNELKEIIIEYNFRMKIKAGVTEPTHGKVILEILKDTEWIPINSVSKSRSVGTTITNWVKGVPITTVNGNGGEWVYTNTDDELQDFFNKDGANYDNLKGLRLRLDGSTDGGGQGYVRGYVDYIKARIKYHAEDVAPIMETITDNTASTITCANVTDWSKTGVTDGDGSSADTFQIGQNTRVIIDDISGFSGVNFEIVDSGGTYDTENVEPDGDVDVGFTPVPGGGEDNYEDVVDDDDATYVQASVANSEEEEIYSCNTQSIDHRGYISQLVITTRGLVHGGTSYRPTIDYYWDGGWASLDETVELTVDSISNITTTITGLSGSQADLDALKIKYTAPVIDNPNYFRIYKVSIAAKVIIPAFHKYMARKFKGLHCIDVLTSVCQLEGAYWCEEHEDEIIKLVKPSEYESSGVSVDETDYDIDWEYEDQCNAKRGVHVWGDPAYNIYANAIDTDVDSLQYSQIQDHSIKTKADAQEVADAQLAILSTKRPSIKITLNGVQADLKLGKTINITMARPTVAATDYKIRLIKREKRGITGIATTIYAGLGETDYDEKIVKEIKRIGDIAHRSMTDKLTSTPWASGASITWADIGGADAGAVAAVNNVLAGDVTGTVAATVVGNDSHTHDTQYYTETEIDALMHIGSGNKGEVQLIESGDFGSTRTFYAARGYWTNVGASDSRILYRFPLPLVIGGSHNLVITKTTVGIWDADEGDELDRVSWECYDSTPDRTTILDTGAGLDEDTIGEYEWDHADTTIGGVYESLACYVWFICTDAGDIKIPYVLVEYYYTA